MKNKLIVANWKMAVDRAAVTTLTRAVGATLGKRNGAADVILCAPHIYLTYVAGIMSGGVKLGAQDVAVPDHPKGAQTGDISPAMLRESGCDYVIIGHSERRARYGESDALIHAKIVAARAAGLTPIVCVGEGADARAAGQAHEVVQTQILAALQNLQGDGPIILAYEPVWAIGGHGAATLDDIRDMHHFIHQVMDKSLAHLGGIRMVYGGSVKPDNIAAILAVPYVDGVLVGGASLDVGAFGALIQACVNAHNS